MMKYLTILLMLCLAVAAINISAQQLTTSLASESNFSLKSVTINNGGAAANGDEYHLQGTIGQPNVDVLQGDSYRLTSGFWHPATGDSVPVNQFEIYLPLVQR